MRTTILLLSILFGTLLLAQPQLENASFETWSDLGAATEEPVEWSSVKTSDGGSLINAFAPQLCWQSADAHTGSYSVNLRTVTSAVGAATGLLTNGRVHAEFTIANSYVFSDLATAEWNTVCGSRPDSLIGWYKAAPEAGDHAKITALMHVDAGKLPMFDTYPNWVGIAAWTGSGSAVTEWTRFSVPFNYLDGRTPEHVLLAMSCGDSTLSTIGTQAWFDDMGLMYNLLATPDAAIALVNAQDGFDLNVAWSTSGEPVGAVDFTAELSDINGDFDNATVIGTANSTLASGSIACTIPAGTLPGSDYRIRVVTPSPYYAPIDAGIVIDLNTGIAERSMQSGRIRTNTNGLIVDLQGTGLKTSGYEMIDARGAIVAKGSLRNDAMNAIRLDGVQGIYLVRVLHSEGAVVGRVFVD